MQSKKILLIVVIALAITALVFFVTKKAKAQSPFSNPMPGPNPGDTTAPSNGGAVTTPAVVQPTNQPTGIFPLTMGSRGKAVQIIQVIVGVTPDGIWGANTQNAVQSKLGDTSITLVEFLTYITAAAAKEANVFPLKTGSRGNYVKALQIIYNLKVDGIFGANTLAAVQRDTGQSQVSTALFQQIFKNVFA